MSKLKYILNFFLYAGCKDEKEYESILPEIHKINKEVLKIVSATLSLLMFLLLISSKLHFFYHDFSLNYLLILLFCLSFTLFLWFLPNQKAKLSQPLLYLFMALAFFFSTLNGILVPTVNAVGFIVIVITIPLLFIDRPIRLIFINLTGMSFFALSVIITKVYPIIIFDITNVLIYGIFGLVLSNYIIYVKVSRILSDKKLIVMSETDLLTGLKNRNSYEENHPKYPEKCRFSLTCIYIDANGLHELNNSKGHKAGDEMLCTIADYLKERFYLPDIYRIGGDEFVVFVVDDMNGSAPVVMKEIEQKLNEKDYHISWGLTAISAGLINMTDLIIETEQKMYKAKTAYYIERGIDRRKARS